MVEQSEKYIDSLGAVTWYLPSRGKGYFHREDGPAIEQILDTDTIKHWFVGNKRHRVDGPAYECPGGGNEWWVYGNRLPIKEVEEWLDENNIDLKTIAGQTAFKLMWA